MSRNSYQGIKFWQEFRDPLVPNSEDNASMDYHPFKGALEEIDR